MIACLAHSAVPCSWQVFRTLTEYMQGPCEGNQLSLAQSRLWDAIGGFFLFFAEMQNRLSRDPGQVELLKEIREMQVGDALRFSKNARLVCSAASMC